MGKVIQVVGYKNSGKTTLMETLIQALRNQGKQVAAIKHHGHGGEPAGSTDSDRFVQAGAFTSVVEGDGTIKIVAKKEKWSLKELLQMQMVLGQPDVILVEGWKQETYTKIVLLRGPEDNRLLDLANVCCFITAKALEPQTSAPVFLRNEQSTYINYLLDYIQKCEADTFVSFNERTD